ncbi:tetratricopeptide repeat protein [Acidobacteria bacterium AH-259-D05]|nr:tetratricopeptide repeat protein [Acidobacteria bacterium AH-259-D05]
MIIAVRVALTVLLLLAGWRVFHQAAALGISELYPSVEGFQEAIRWDPSGPDYYYHLGLIYRDSPDLQHLQLARYYLEKATELNPYNWWYWLGLARSYEISNMAVQAERAYLRAVEINPREAVYRWRFANFYLREGELEKALSQFKSAIALEPAEYLQSTLTLLWKAETRSEDILSMWPQDKNARLVLVSFLVGQSGVEQGLLDRQWEKLLGSSDIPTVGEGEFYIRSLLDGKRFDKAREEWIRLVSRNGLEDGAFFKKENLLWNGQFHLPITRRVLDWIPRINADTTQISADKGLRIEFKGTENINFNGLQQLVIVDPGEEYEFSFKAGSEQISTEQGLYFQVVAGSVLFETEQILGTVPLTEYSGRFRVPRDKNLVTVRLRRRPSKRIDNKLRGTLWVDWVKLQKVSGL